MKASRNLNEYGHLKPEAKYLIQLRFSGRTRGHKPGNVSVRVSSRSLWNVSFEQRHQSPQFGGFIFAESRTLISALEPAQRSLVGALNFWMSLRKCLERVRTGSAILEGDITLRQLWKDQKGCSVSPTGCKMTISATGPGKRDY